MDKILISNSFKNLLQSLGAKTSNSNYAVPVVTAGSGTTAGTPQGYMDMTSLASVLGGRYNTIQANDDLNDPKFRECGYVYICIASTTGRTLVNTPDDGNFGAFRLEIVPCASTSLPMQRIYYASKTSPRVYVRYYENEWGAWKQLAFAE